MQDDEATVGQVLRLRLVEQVAALREAERSIRNGDDEGVHEARVACRRLQAALAMFRPAVDVRVSEPLREELGWLAGSLGGARDQNVAQERLTALAARDGEAAGLLLAQLRRADPSPGDDDQRRNAAVLAVLGSPRYADLLSGLDGFVSEPGWTARGDGDAGPFVRRRLRKEWSGSPSGRPWSRATRRDRCPTCRSTTYARRRSDCATGWRSPSCCGFGSRSDFAGRPTSSPTSSENATTSPSPGRSCSSWRRRLRQRASRPSSTGASTGSRSHGQWSWRHSSSGVWAETVACRSHWP